jgi:hypothetical protein
MAAAGGAGADDDVMADEAALDAQRQAQLEAREKAAEAALRTGKAGDALKAALADPPFASKNAGIKERSAALVLRAVVSLGAKDADLAAFLEALDGDAADALMKVRGLPGRCALVPSHAAA